MAVKTRSTIKPAIRSIAGTVLKKSKVTTKRKTTGKRVVKSLRTTTRGVKTTRSLGVSKRNILPKDAIGAYSNSVTIPQFLPFFHIKFEKFAGGIKCWLGSNSPDAVINLNRYFQSYTGSMVSLNLLLNGVPWFNFNFAFGNCNWKPIGNGGWYVCNTTDRDYLKALHSFVELANYSLKYGCTCCLSIGGNPLCCCIL